MKGIIILFFLTLTLVGCGKLRSQKLFAAIKKNGNIAGLEEPVQHILKLSELKIAQRLCNSLKTKRTILEAALTGTPPKAIAYSFSLERRNCKNAVIESIGLNAQILLVSNDLEFSTNQSASYFIDVNSDKSVEIAPICAEKYTST